MKDYIYRAESWARIKSKQKLRSELLKKQFRPGPHEECQHQNEHLLSKSNVFTSLQIVKDSVQFSRFSLPLTIEMSTVWAFYSLNNKGYMIFFCVDWTRYCYFCMILLLGCTAVLRTWMRPIVTDWIAWSVGLFVCHSSEPCKNGWTDRDAVWVEDSGGPMEPCIRWGSRSAPVERSKFEGKKGVLL